MFRKKITDFDDVFPRKYQLSVECTLLTKVSEDECSQHIPKTFETRVKIKSIDFWIEKTTAKYSNCAVSPWKRRHCCLERIS